MANEIVVTNGLIGIEPPTASRMPPTADTTANTVLSTGASTGEAVTRNAAAAGVTSRESTSRAPTTWTARDTARPSRRVKAIDSAPAGTPRAAATSGSTLANIRGRQTTAIPASTTIDTTVSQPSRTVSTATIWPVSRPNLLAARPS